MSQVAAWPRTLPQDASLALRQLLKSAASVFGAPRALLAWGETDEPWLHQAAWADGDDFQERRDPRGTFDPLVAEALDGVNFLSLDAAGAAATAQRLLDKQPAAARQRLTEIQHLIADEQRNLRFFIRDGTLDPLSVAAGDVRLETRLRLMAQRLEDVWGLRVGIELEELNGVADHLAYDICHLVQEALANAARHAGASAVRVTLAARDGGVDIVVADDGRGFPFQGDS